MTSKNLSASEKLSALRAEMVREKVDGFIVPRVDIYQGEFVAPHAERLAWLTGFTGSAGVAVVLKDKAVVLTDGRYTIQLNQQIDSALYKTDNIVKISSGKWISENAPQGAVIGYDPQLHTPKQIEMVEALLADKAIRIKPLSGNLIDRVWQDRPKAPAAKAEIFPESAAGSSAAQKKERIHQNLKEKKIFASVINMPDSLAWLLNVRGDDIASTPVVLSLGIVYGEARPVKWFVDSGKITPAVKTHIGNSVETFDPTLIEKHIDDLAAEAKRADLPIGLDFLHAPVWFKQRLETTGAKVVNFKDPCILPKAMKTPAEQESIRKAHVTDGIAVAKFLFWLDEEGAKGISELDVVEKFEAIRKEDKAYKGPSFDTIAGWAGNGAIVHYRASDETNKKIIPPGILLVDSGGQYHYGTTDITRTVSIGAPTEEMKKNFTLVLKGHIAVARARFPENTTGAQVDALARQPLWAENLDYAHGTGHGVGCFLSVHEEATSISTRGADPFKPGMLISNEPGYYKENEYGIRIENLVFVKDAGENSDGQKTFAFETVTLAPIDLNLVKAEMLSPEEKSWLNDYHANVIKIIGPKLDSKTRDWLELRARAL